MAGKMSWAVLVYWVKYDIMKSKFEGKFNG